MSQYLTVPPNMTLTSAVAQPEGPAMRAACDSETDARSWFEPCCCGVLSDSLPRLGHAMSVGTRSLVGAIPTWQTD